MKEQRKRIFISELPETATEDIIKDAFNQYGHVQNIEIKERKELGPKNSSLFFSYVNIDINERELQKCFKDFADGKWLGQYVMLQVARESFLERIRREREENNPDRSQDENRKNSVDVEIIEIIDEPNEKYNERTEVTHKSPVKKPNTSTSEVDLEDIDYVIKDNKRKSRHEALKIESVGKEPIYVQDSKHKTNLNTSNPANQKRLDSLKQFKQSYQQQKTLIKAALSNVDQPNNKKKIFDNDNEHSFSPTKQQKLNNSSTHKSLFEDQSEDEEDNFEANFAVKEQFLGEKGQKLLELQSRYKNDKRFQLDSRFIEDEETQNEAEEITENSLEEEKNKQLEILEGILGKKITPKTKRTTDNTKMMLRFDPSQPDHSKFEIPKEPKKKKNRKEDSTVNEKKLEETDTPVVSKEVFYKVNENIKNSLHKNEGFSLLEAFGVAEEKEKGKEEEAVEATASKSFQTPSEANPFTYDSSEDEDETENVTNQGFNKSLEPKFMWTESLFFGGDDYRLQEGFDFIEKMKHDDQDFVKLRRELKHVIRTKVRNNLAKKKPFKRKLGGSKMKKVMRIKKALKK